MARLAVDPAGRVIVLADDVAARLAGVGPDEVLGVLEDPDEVEPSGEVGRGLARYRGEGLTVVVDLRGDEGRVVAAARDDGDRP